MYAMIKRLLFGDLQVGLNNEQNRDRWIAEKIKAIPSGTSILDAGAGEQRLRPLCGHLAYVSQDFAQYDGKGDGSGMHTGTWDQTKLDIVSDITSIPRPDGSFQAVLCIEVLEHLPTPQDAIREFSRLLAPGGILILTAPFWSMTHFAPYHFATGFNRYWYQHHLLTHGFVIEELTPNGNYFDNVAQEVWRLDSETRNHPGIKMSLIDKISSRLLLRYLQRASRLNPESSAQLCFGYQLVARKVQIQGGRHHA